MEELELIDDFSKLGDITTYRLELVLLSLKLEMVRLRVKNSWVSIVRVSRIRMQIKLIESELVDRILIGDDDVQT